MMRRRPHSGGSPGKNLCSLAQKRRRKRMKGSPGNDQMQNFCARSCEYDECQHCCCTPWTRVGEEERRYWFVGAARQVFGPRRGGGGGGGDRKGDGKGRARMVGRDAEKEEVCRMQAAALMGRRDTRCSPVDRDRRARPRCFFPAPRRAATLRDNSPLWLFPVLLVVAASLVPAASCQIVEEQRKGVDDWTPEEVVKWLGRQGLRPWEREDILKKAQDHGLDGSLLLSLTPSSILHVIGLDPIDDKGGNVEALSGGIANLRAQVASRPVDVWEYRTAHRRRAALLQTAMMTTPRLATLYAMLVEGNAVVLIFGRAGPSLLLLLSIMIVPHLSLAILSMQLSTRGGAIAWLLCLSHLSLFSASLLHLSTLPPSSWPRASLAAEAKLIPLTLLAASASFLAPWWLVDLLHTIAVSTPLLLFALVAHRKRLNHRRAARLAQSQSRGAQWSLKGASSWSRGAAAEGSQGAARHSRIAPAKGNASASNKES